jgi:hypothetical protein
MWISPCADMAWPHAGHRDCWQLIELTGAPGGTRTPDFLVRSQVLYPAELRARMQFAYIAELP